MKIYNIFFLVFVAAFFSTSISAEENQLWGSVSVNGPVNADNKWLVWFDGHARTRNDRDNLGVTIIRPGIGWRVSKNLDLWAGYARVTARRDTGSAIDEDRIWQQATYRIAMLEKGTLTGRTRLEQRFHQSGDDTGWRLRQTIGYSQPLESNPNISFVLSNELFLQINDTDWGQRNGYDQNRAFAGFRIKHAPNFSTTIGYLNNNIDLGPAGSTTNHNLSIGLGFKL